MNPTTKVAATAYVAPKILKNFKLRWIFYGVGVYYGLKYLKRQGYNVDSAINFIDQGIDMAKKNIGLQESHPTH